jgi:hypothetical protein
MPKTPDCICCLEDRAQPLTIDTRRLVMRDFVAFLLLRGTVDPVRAYISTQAFTRERLVRHLQSLGGVPIQPSALGYYDGLQMPDGRRVYWPVSDEDFDVHAIDRVLRAIGPRHRVVADLLLGTEAELHAAVFSGRPACYHTDREDASGDRPVDLDKLSRVQSAKLVGPRHTCPPETRRDRLMEVADRAGRLLAIVAGYGKLRKGRGPLAWAWEPVRQEAIRLGFFDEEERAEVGTPHRRSDDRFEEAFGLFCRRARDIVDPPDLALLTAPPAFTRHHLALTASLTWANRLAQSWNPLVHGLWPAVVQRAFPAGLTDSEQRTDLERQVLKIAHASDDPYEKREQWVPHNDLTSLLHTEWY